MTFFHNYECGEDAKWQFSDSLGKTYKLAHIMFKPSLLRYITLQNFIRKSPVWLQVDFLSYLWAQASKIVYDRLTTTISVIRSKKKLGVSSNFKQLFCTSWS